jgi:ABC-2 type transport system permease protein
MSTFYTNVQVYGSKILYRGIDNGRKVRLKIDYYPTLYVPSQKPTEFTTIHGEYVAEVKPGTIRECRDFVKQYDGVQGFKIHGNQKYEYAFIADTYPDVMEWDIDHINVCNIDIEVGSENGFPEPATSSEPITAITMKMIAEEKKSGTWEILRTSPLRNLEIILAKYLAAFTLVFIAVLPTLVYYFSIVQLGDPVGNIDHAGFFGSWIGLLFIGAVFSAIGIFASALTSHQIIAFIWGVFMIFLLYFGLTALVQLQVMSSFALLLEELSLSYHYESMSRGVIEAQNVAYFLSIIILMLGLTVILIRRK